MVLQRRATIDGVVFYEDVTLDRNGQVIERHAIEVDAGKAAGKRVWYRLEAPDGRELATSDTTERIDGQRERVALSEADKTIAPRMVFSVEPPERSAR